MSPIPPLTATARVRRLSLQVGGLLVALACVAGLEWLDEVTGPHYGFSLFYLVPVVAVAWFLGGFLAGLVAVCAAVAWFLAELAWRPMDTLVAVAWNSTTRLVIFLTVGWLVARVRASREALLAANRRLAALLGRESVLARTDPLTELPNWRAFEERLGAEIARARRSGMNLCVGYLDLDNFKRVNDRYGHGAGDALLRRIAASLGEALRPEDALARVGGDEFAFLMNGARPEDLEEIGRRLIERVQQLGQSYPGTDLGASVGLVCGLPLRRGQEELVNLADQAMYQAKQAGKGQVRLDFLDKPSLPGAPD
jgi:diguanylate cyclase (GGDEF)-like protein